MAEGKVKMAERRERGGGGLGWVGEHEGCQVSGFGSASVHSSPLYLG